MSIDKNIFDDKHLDAPVLPQIDKGNIYKNKLGDNNMLTVRVPQYAGMKTMDVIVAYFGSISSQPQVALRPEPLDIPFHAKAVPVGRYNVFYTVMDADRKIRQSLPVTVTVGEAKPDSDSMAVDAPLILNVTPVVDDAIANGTDMDLAHVTATRDGVPQKDQVFSLNILNGSAFFSNNKKTIETSTDINGNKDVPLMDTQAETVQVQAFSDSAKSDPVDFKFRNRNPDGLGVTLTSIHDNAPADGRTPNTARGQVTLDGVTYNYPTVMTFTISGSDTAKFTENNQNYISIPTTVFGQATADFTDTVSEDVFLVASIESDTVKSNTLGFNFSQNAGQYNIIISEDSSNAVAGWMYGKDIGISVFNSNIQRVKNVPVTVELPEFCTAVGFASNIFTILTDSEDSDTKIRILKTDQTAGTVAVKAACIGDSKTHIMNFDNHPKFLSGRRYIELYKVIDNQIEDPSGINCAQINIYTFNHPDYDPIMLDTGSAYVFTSPDKLTKETKFTYDYYTYTKYYCIDWAGNTYFSASDMDSGFSDVNNSVENKFLSGSDLYSVKIVGENSVETPDGNQYTSISVLVTANNNPVPDVYVEFSSPDFTYYYNPMSPDIACGVGRTNSSGYATVTVREKSLSTPGERILTATALGCTDRKTYN